MFASVGATFSATAYLKSVGSTEYISQMAVFLMLLSWSSPIETAIGNLVLHNGRYNQSAKGKKNGLGFPIFYRVVVGSVLLTMVFYTYAWGSLEINNEATLIIVLLFIVRMTEYALKTKAIIVDKIKSAQIYINGFSAFKWGGSTVLFAFGYVDFCSLLTSHIIFGLVDCYILNKICAIEYFPENKIGAESELKRQEALSVIGIVLGVGAFQLDKLAAGYFLDSYAFGQYVLMCSLVFIGPFLLNPIFSLYQQNIVRDKNKLMDTGVSILRLVSIVVFVFTLPMLTIVTGLSASKGTFVVDSQVGFVALASFLNCMAHSDYLRYQAEGRLDLILKQNVASLLTGLLSLMIVFLMGVEEFSYVLASAAMGQYIFGVFKRKESVTNKRLYKLNFICIPLVVPCALLNSVDWPPNFPLFSLEITFAITLIFIAYKLELWGFCEKRNDYLNDLRSFLVRGS